MKNFNPGCLTIDDYLNSSNVQNALIETLLETCYNCLEQEDISFDELMSAMKSVETSLEMTAIRIQMELENSEEYDDDEDEEDALTYEIFF